jgi:hypothetical protein
MYAERAAASTASLDATPMLQCRLPDIQDRRHAPISAQASIALVAGLSAARRMAMRQATAKMR